MVSSVGRGGASLLDQMVPLLFPGRFFYNSNEAHKHQEGEEHKLEEEDDSRVK